MCKVKMILIINLTQRKCMKNKCQSTIHIFEGEKKEVKFSKRYIWLNYCRLR